MAGQAEEKRCFALAERLQKLIAAAGLCSRRTAEEWIAAGRVRVNGETATVGQSADPETDTICVDGVPLTPPERRVYLMLNKPRGYVTTLSDERGRPTAAELVADCGTRVYPVGRLDLDSEGLLLFTNDGAWMQRILHPSHEIEKTYEVTVAGVVENAAAELAAVRSVDGEPIAPACVCCERGRKQQSCPSPSTRGKTAKSGGCVQRSGCTSSACAACGSTPYRSARCRRAAGAS